MRIGRQSELEKASQVLGKGIDREPDELHMICRGPRISQCPGSFTPEQLGMEDDDIVDLQT